MQSAIAAMNGEIASALGDELRESTRSFDREHAPANKAVELDRIRQRLATLQAQVSTTVVESDRPRT